MLLRQCQNSLDWWERFACSGRGLALMFLWALAEATVWPIIPDALLVPMAVGARRFFPRLLAASIVGSTLGGIMTFSFASYQPEAATAILPHLPTVQPHAVERANSMLAERRVMAFWAQPLSGLPFKTFAVLGAAQDMDPWQVMSISTAARALRMGSTGGIAALLAWPLRGFLRDFFLYLAVAYLLLFAFGWWLTQM